MGSNISIRCHHNPLTPIRGDNTLNDSISLLTKPGIYNPYSTNYGLSLLRSSFLPSIKDNNYIVALSLPVFSEGVNKYLPLLFEVSMIDTDDVVAVDDY